MVLTRQYEQCHSMLAAAALTTAVVQAAGAATPISDDLFPRVRSTDTSLAVLIARGTRESATFKSLTEAIGATDGLIYVEPGGCPLGVRACLRMSVQVSGPYRLLRISIDTRNDKSDVELIASIGHELQHAVEGLSERAVTNGVRLYNFFRRYAPTSGATFETVAAVNAGHAIRDELKVVERSTPPG